MDNKIFLSVILPVFNEEHNIRKVVFDVDNFLSNSQKIHDYEIIAVNDGSVDKTSPILKDLEQSISRLKIAEHKYNRGYGETLLTGFHKSRYPWILFMDADGQMRIKSLESMLPYISFDAIIGIRHKRNDSLYRILLGKAYVLSAFILFGIKVRDVNCGFKLIKRNLLESVNYGLGGNLFYAHIFRQLKNKKITIKEVPIEHFPRSAGKETGGSPAVILRAIFEALRMMCNRV